MKIVLMFCTLLIAMIIPVIIYWLGGGDFNRSVGLGATTVVSIMVGAYSVMLFHTFYDN